VALATAIVAAPGAGPAAAGTELSSTTTFSAGAEGWVGPSGGGGATTLVETGGNPDHNMRTVFNDFGITFANATAAFVADLTPFQAVAISIDLKVEEISFFGTPVSRPWLVELRDTTDPEPGYPWTSVWYKFDDVAVETHGEWTRFTVFVNDPAAEELPAGWGGYGAEGDLGEPMLPKDRTFASVLAGYDEIAWTTFEPGFFFGFTDHTVRIDNPTLASGIFGDGFESGMPDAWSVTIP
jgi:hypothetical protein